MSEKLNFYLDPEKRKKPASSIMNYKRNEKGLYLMAKGRLIQWTDVHTYCPSCLSPLGFDEEFDASYCEECNEWREEPCTDPACDYCSKRPDKPRDLR